MIKILFIPNQLKITKKILSSKITKIRKTKTYLTKRILILPLIQKN